MTTAGERIEGDMLHALDMIERCRAPKTDAEYAVLADSMRAEECVRAFKPLAEMGPKTVSPRCGNCGFGEMLTGSGYVRCSAPIPESATNGPERVDVKSNDGDCCPCWKARGEA